MKYLKKLNLTYISVLAASISFIIFMTTLNKREIRLDSNELRLIKESMLDLELRNFDESRSILSSREKLGKKIFNDTNFSNNNDTSCATCHVPEDNFHDKNNISRKINPNSNFRAISIRGTGGQDWYFWNGRKDSLWAQVLEAIIKDHNLTKLQAVEYICGQYLSDYLLVLDFCNSSNSLQDKFVNVGKLISDYVSSIPYYWSRFDEFSYQVIYKSNYDNDILSDDELEGMKLFFDSQRTGCINCHSGKRFSNGGFYSIGTGGNNKNDRAKGLLEYKNSDYKCDLYNKKVECRKYQYVNYNNEIKGAFKVPSLRTLNKSPSYMHDGRYKNLEEVIEFYVNPYRFPLTHTDVKPLRLLPHQRQQLIKFLTALGDKHEN
ncbi:cytochrome-c peroxidase [Vibrio paucivorans]